MKIGYYVHVQGSMDEAFIWGLIDRWCPGAEKEKGKFRGSTGESLRREIRKALLDLQYKSCDILIMLTDSDVSPWREVKKREWEKVPMECRHLAVFGVAERNIECWLAIDKRELAKELGCEPNDIPANDPSGFVQRRFGLGERGSERENAKKKIERFIANVPMKLWIQNSDSFNDFYKDIRSLSKQRKCTMPNELERT